MTRRETGNNGEAFVCDYLEKNNYKIIKKNYTIKGGEIDIIAEKDNVIAFVEVKTRAKNALVSGFEAITKSKKLRIMKTAQHYFMNNDCDLQPRFDVAVVETLNDKAVKIEYVENAYDMSDTNIFF